MTLPANIRVNATFPFPSLVTGSGPVTLAKANGIWTIGLSADVLGVQTPPPASYPTDFVIVWDDVLNTWFKMPLSALPGSGGGIIQSQRLVTTTPIVVAPTDQIINCRVTTPALCMLPLSDSRAGAPLRFKDLGQAFANNITITATAGNTIDGQPSLVLANNYQSVTLVPLTDGTSVGWVTQ